MPALKPVPNTARVVVNLSFSSLPVVNVFHFTKVTPVTPFSQAEIDALATTFRTAFSTAFIPNLNPALILGTVTAIDLSSDVGVVGTATGTTAGGNAGAPNPANVALCVTWKINRHYRGGHPRTYLAGTNTLHTQTVNTWAGTAVTAFTTAANSFRTSVNGWTGGTGATGALVTVHRKKDNVDYPTPLISVITSATVGPRIDSQRRRLGSSSA